MSSILQANVAAPGLPSGRYRLELSGGRIRGIDRIGAMAEPASASDQIEILADDEVLLPAFADAHTHLLGVGTARLKPDLRGSASREEAFARLSAWLEAHPGDDPVIAEGWDQSLWSDPALPTRAEIDRVTSRPVALRRVCGHVAVLNTAALARIGEGWDQLDSDSGLALEALPLRLSRLWPRSVEMLDQAIQYAQGVAFRRGVASIQEMGDPTSFRAFGRAEAAGHLQLRVNHFFQLDALESVIHVGMTAGAGSEHLRIGGIKLFLDGSIGGRTAAVREPYRSSAGGGTGMLLFTDVQLRERLQRCAEDDLPVALHAIGDAAVEQALRVVERLAARGVSAAAPGPRLEHAEMLPPDLAVRAVAAGFLLSMQPNFTARWQGSGGLYEQMLGPARARSLNPYRAAYRTGRLLFGSDTMPFDPLLGLRGACNHPDPEQRLDLLEAIDAYTSGFARGMRAPFGNGRLEPGEPADLVALRFASIAPGDAGTPSPGITARPAAGAGSSIAPGVSGTEAAKLLDRAVVSGTWIAGRCVHRLARAESADP